MAKDKKKPSLIIYVAFVLYMILLCWFCFFSDAFGRTPKPYYRYNFVPFNQLRNYISSTGRLVFSWSFVLNILGNIAVFIPYGIMYPHLFYKRRVTVFETVLTALAASTIIEVIQFFSKTGVCDVDDLILNTLGGLFGYIVCVLINSIENKMEKK